MAVEYCFVVGNCAVVVDRGDNIAVIVVTADKKFVVVAVVSLGIVNNFVVVCVVVVGVVLCVVVLLSELVLSVF